MYFTFCKCKGNILQTASECARRYQLRHPSDAKIIRRLDDRLTNTEIADATHNLLNVDGKMQGELTTTQ